MTASLNAVVSVCAAVGLLAGTASALITIDTVTVGDVGNVGDTRYLRGGVSSFGSVGYTYNIGKYEVTAAQYAAFLNAKAKTDTYGLYNASMWGDPYGCKIERTGSSGNYSYSVAAEYANRPVNYVSYWDACRFTNWLHNGQENGDTETGAYTLNSYNGSDGRTIQRNADWKWAVTSEDEWYKAAYHKSGSTNAGYWDYPTSSNSINTGMANYDMSVGHTTDAGSYGNASPYGTFDQGGNVWEWNEANVYDGYSYRGLRGGSFHDGYDILHASSRYGYGYPTNEYYSVAFRVSAAVVPENDEDGDGVPDSRDSCPGTPACATVDPNGCPSDGDADSVFDGCDQCPDSPSGAWVNRTTGCLTSRADLDRDGDVDQVDFGILQQCSSGPDVPADPDCAN